MIGYVTVKHPITAEPIAVIPTGRTEDEKAEVICVTPKTGISTMWITKNDIIHS